MTEFFVWNAKITLDWPRTRHKDCCRQSNSAAVHQILWFEWNRKEDGKNFSAQNVEMNVKLIFTLKLKRHNPSELKIDLLKCNSVDKWARI